MKYLLLLVAFVFVPFALRAPTLTSTVGNAGRRT
jgi:hypothetical protein